MLALYIQDIGCYKKPKVRIIWDGNDAVNKETESPDLKKENTLKNLFKKD